MKFDLIVIGGGAAGFFGAIQAAESKAGLKVLILEKTSKLLSKVRISGGGRCNVTHNCINPFELTHHYPRGEKALKTVFKIYHVEHVVQWFASKGVKLKAESDGRMFPVTDSSESVINCFLQQAKRLNINIQLGVGTLDIKKEEGCFTVVTELAEHFQGTKLLIATGGNVNIRFYDWIKTLGHTIKEPIPSLFTFNDSENNFKDLMGISVPDAEVKIAGTKFSQKGPLLITHWGLSGPAIIKLSAWAAQHLHDVNYHFDILVSWVGAVKEGEFRSYMNEHKKSKGKQKIVTNPMFSLSQRLWQRLCELSEIEESKIWNEISLKSLNKLTEHLIRCPFHMKGKTTFKEEFVTCGGVDLKEINLDTMESKVVKNLYFAGEVLNIDGETGGFNFQAAWSTAFLAARSIAG
ncbi:MAG: aminoacetone oxidase family FAD-binding enzyme [Marivirga sp.]|nr:aminoacetone oxidase family FAD-binding enzyme [Marivirga sp.]